MKIKPKAPWYQSPDFDLALAPTSAEPDFRSCHDCAKQGAIASVVPDNMYYYCRDVAVADRVNLKISLHVLNKTRPDWCPRR